MPDNRKATQRINVTLPNATQLKTGDDYRAAAARRQADWRKRHFQLHGELAQIVDSLAKAPDLLDRLGNSNLARVIRKAVKDVQDEL